MQILHNTIDMASNGRWALLITNATGRSDEPLLIGESYQAGDYELLMHFDEYFARKEEIGRAHV